MSQCTTLALIVKISIIIVTNIDYQSPANLLLVFSLIYFSYVQVKDNLAIDVSKSCVHEEISNHYLIIFFQTRLIWLLCLGHWTNQDFLHSIWHLLSLIGSLTASSGVTHLFMSDLQNSQRGNSDSTSPSDLARFTFQTWFI